MREEIIGDCRLILGDCRDVLPTLGKVDAVVTDPPYGIGESAGKAKTRTTGFSPRVKGLYQKDYGDDDWDDAPIPDDLMDMVREAGRWNIIFGGNYYAFPPTSCWLVWDKLNGDTDFADCELAWTNLPKAVRRIRFLWNGCMRGNGETRGDHPTQKPIQVMSWSLSQLPKSTTTILDPFMGSGTTGVACVRNGLSFVGVEQIERHFDAACRRIEAAINEPRLFAEPVVKAVQESLL
jgi:DNA modification methylase